MNRCLSDLVVRLSVAHICSCERVHTLIHRSIHCECILWKRPLNLNRVKLSVRSRSVLSSAKEKKVFPFYFVFCRLVFLLLPSSTSSSSSIHSFCDPNRNRRPRGVCSHVFSAIQLRQPSSVFLIIICQKCCDARQPKLKWMKATTREYVHEKKEADTFQVNIASVSSFFPFYFK